jgi:predicted ATPase
LLVGRATEVRALTDLVAGGAEGRGGAAFVLGEAGIGKSRMLTAISDIAHSRQMVVLRGRAASSSAPAPYRPIAEALLSALRGHDLGDDPTLDRLRSAVGVLVPGSTEIHAGDDPSVVLLGEATLALVERCGPRRGAVLLLEDLQWADAETCELIDYLVDKLDGRPVVLVASVRTGAPSEAARLAQAVAARRHGVLISLNRLDAAEVDVMIGAALQTEGVPAAVGEAVAAASGGVPFLVEELLASLVQSGALWRDGPVWRAEPSLPTLVPTSFEMIVAERLGGLTPSARTVLDAAAVLGERFDWRLLASVTGLTEDEVVASLAEGKEAQLVDELPGTARRGYRFRHGLSRAAVLEALPELRRERVAQRALGVLDIDPDTPTGPAWRSWPTLPWPPATPAWRPAPTSAPR